jgi:putative phosphoserine phosphatase/1-acylglycerol-3-phosphate O-acyltransferase
MSELILAHALGEIEASPSGPDVGAFFDLDGTLIEGFSATVFLQHRLRNREIGAVELARMLRLGIDGLLGRAGFEELMAASGRAYEGRPDTDLAAVGERLFDTKIAKMVYRDVRRLVEAHQSRGHTVVLASSATSYQVEPVAASLGIDHVVCNRMSVNDDGVLTGEVVSPVIWGAGKATAAQELAQRLGVDLAASYFYADGDEDVALMHLVGHPRPVNPRSRLEAVARHRGWPILRVSGTPSTGTIGKLRNAVGVAALAPSIAVGAGVGLVRRDKRAALNTTVPLWTDLLFLVNGVKVNVVIGEEYLRSPRPSVFIFNHKNNWDSFVAMSVIRTDVTGVAKKELEKQPMFGVLGRWMDVAFVDRSNSASAVAQLKPLEDLARKGLSLVVAPEGTRSPTGQLLPFKKGAFRMAMATGLPIIPIVVRNAEVLGDHDSTTLRPGTVDVAVLPPISVKEWTLDDLEKRIEEVHRLYEGTLADWPF